MKSLIYCLITFVYTAVLLYVGVECLNVSPNSVLIIVLMTVSGRWLASFLRKTLLV